MDEITKYANNTQTIALSNVKSLSEALNKNTKLYFFLTALGALFLYLTLLENWRSSLLDLWFICTEINSVILVIYCHLARKSSYTRSPFFIGGLIINAVIWGILGVIIIPTVPVEAHILIVMVTLGIVLPGIPLCHFSTKLVILFTSITLLPLSIFFFTQRDTISIAVGIAILSLIPASLLAVRIGRDYKSRAEILEKKYRRLIDQLNCAIEEKETANKELICEINEKKKTAGELIKARDTAEDAVKVKSEFLATMSHEIRTPMNGVIGMAELLLSTDLSSKQQRFTETIHKSGKALLAIINDILDFSKIEAGKLELNDSVFDLRQLIEELGVLFAEQAHRKGLELNYIYPVDGHTTFRGDDERIRQILINLLGNAIKFTKEGEVVIKVDLSDKGNDNIHVRFCVQDSGIGIDENVQKKIFDSFSQADGSTTRRFGGTGLGLTICKKLCDLMGGKIAVKSQPGTGSSFSFSIPLKKEASLKPQLSKVIDRRLKKVRLLIVDGNKTRREIFRREFEHWKIQHTCTSCPHKARRLLHDARKKGEPFHLVIMDSNLADPGDIKLLLENQDQTVSSTRFILMNSLGNMETSGQWLVSDVDAFLNKPVQQKELYKTLRTTLFPDDSTLDMTRMNSSLAVLQDLEKFTLQGHIMVAEDNIVNQELAREMVISLGCTLEVVDNGQAVLEAITSLPAKSPSPYELILMDCQMPVMDGYEATKKLREWEAQKMMGQRIPVIALTANAMEGDREKCLKVGMDDYMSKPFNTEQLGAILHRWLPLYRKEKQAPATESATTSQGGKPESDPQEAVNQPEPSTLLDITALDKIRALQRAGQPNVVIKVIQLFLDNSQKIVQSLEDAISKGDHKTLSRAASSFQSSCNTVGAVNLAQICAELGALGKAGNAGKAQARLSKFEDEYDALREALEELIALENKQ